MSALLLAALSGAACSGVGIAYRLGQSRQIAPLQIALMMCGIGALMFGVRIALAPAGQWPIQVIVAAVLAGTTQYTVARLVRSALHHGPLSPLVCACSLAFVPVILYATLVLGEPMTRTQIAGAGAGILCVLISTLQRHDKVSPGGARFSGVYAGILLAVFLLNSVTFTLLKELGTREMTPGQSFMALCRNEFLFLLYAVVCVCILIDLGVTRRLAAPLRPWLGLGFLAGASSVAAMWMLAVASSLPAAMVFTISSVCQILVGSIVSVLGFRERATAVWFLMLALGVAAVILANLYAFG
jgi:drug/metabolite transporter (DMT)-like permease